MMVTLVRKAGKGKGESRITERNGTRMVEFMIH